MQQGIPKVIPIEHASLVLEWGEQTIYADPVGEPALFAQRKRPDLILVTHEHGDHFSPQTLEALLGTTTKLIVPPSVYEKLPAVLQQVALVMKNGDVQSEAGVTVTAIPAYNIRPEALQYHPKGRDNGYVLTGSDCSVYIAGDTEDTPEMRALRNIHIAFMPMNLPYTMSVEKAAEGVLALKPKVVYPYHYRNPDGQSDINLFKTLVEAGDPAIEVRLADWYHA